MLRAPSFPTPRAQQQPRLHAQQRNRHPLLHTNRAERPQKIRCRPPRRVTGQQVNRTRGDKNPQARQDPEIQGRRRPLRLPTLDSGIRRDFPRRTGIGLNWIVVSQKVRTPLNRMPPEASPSPTAGGPPPPIPKPRENLWVNLVCNAVLPGLLLTQLSKPERLGPVWGLIIALAVPLGYGIYDLVRRQTWNALSIIGLVSTLLTGGLGLMKVNNLWFAVKEAAIPLVLGLAIPLTLKTRQPLVRTMIYNDQVLDTDRIGKLLVERRAIPGFEALLRAASWLLAGAFLFSAILNFLLARWIVTAPPGSAENVAQLGRLNWISYPVIMVPSLVIMMVALFRLLKGLEALTGLSGDELFHPSARTPAPDGTPPR